MKAKKKEGAGEVPPDPVGMRFSLSRYPDGAWLKVEPSGYCRSAYNAKYYGIHALPELDDERAVYIPKTPKASAKGLARSRPKTRNTKVTHGKQ